MNHDGNPPRLILPARLKTRPEPGPLVGRYLTYEELTGRRSSISELLALLATVRRSDAIRWSAALLEFASQRDGIDRGKQLALAAELLDEPLLDALRRQESTEEPWVLFHRRQLWLFLQLSVLVCSETTEPAGDGAALRTIGKACLMVSDFLHQVERVQVPAPPDGAGLEWLITLLISQVDVPHGNELLARARLFWFDSLQDSTVRKELEKLNVGSDLSPAFEARYGIALSEFMFTATILYFTFLRSANERPISPALVDAAQWGGGVFPDEVKKKVFGLLSRSAENFAAYLFGTPRQSWATDQSPLLRYPLLEVNPGQYACPDLSFFRLFFVDGVFWLLNDAIDSKGWRSFFGSVYEWYITTLIESFTVSSERLARTFFRATKFQGTEDQVSDGLILWENNALLCEYKSNRLTTRQRAGVEFEETVDAIRLAAGSKDSGVGQLARSISRVLAGDVVVSGNTKLDLRSCRQIIPVLVLYEESAGNHPARNYLQGRFDELLDVRPSDAERIGPLLLFTTQDMEALEELTHLYSAESIITDYASIVRKFPRAPESMFRAFASIKFASAERRRGLVMSKLDALLTELQAEYARREGSALGLG